ncbi:MAG: bifunctional nuclease family protein [Acidimicrobiales bacterium]|jgi:bifunctional DNase/RNase
MTLAGASGPPTDDEPLAREAAVAPREQHDTTAGDTASGQPEQEDCRPGEAAPGPSEEEATDPGRWRLAGVTGVSMELPGVHPEVVLRESQAPYRVLRIPVGFAEGTAIAYAWRHIATPRPLTHELATEILSAHQVKIEAVRITARRGQSFYAELDTMGPRGRRVVPCRPSDAIALLLRQPMPTPLLVADEVFEGREPAQS